MSSGVSLGTGAGNEPGGGGRKIRRGRTGSTQTYDGDAHWELVEHDLAVTSKVHDVITDTPRPIQFAALRLAATTVLRFRPLREWVKRRLVRRLITGATPWSISHRRMIHLGRDLAVTDDAELPDGVTRVDPGGPFTAIHMASQGYWQIQDEGA